MKLALVGITALLFVFFSSMSHADERPLLGKYNYPGFVPEELFRMESCEVFQGGYILHTVRNLETTESANKYELKIPVIEVEALIMMAKEEELLKKENYLCDTPTTSIRAFGGRELNPEGKLILFETGGCGALQEERQGRATQVLRGILDLYCPQTHTRGPH